MKKLTKIVATISDIRCDVDFLRALHEAGMNVVRCNTAHMDLEGIARIAKNTRAVSDKIALLVDTKGPEVRITAADDPIVFRAGDKIEVFADPERHSASGALSVTYSGFVGDVPEGKEILIDDGDISLVVDEKRPDRLVCTVQNDGCIESGRKSVNVPGVSIRLPSLTEKDKKFVRWAAENNFDFIAHSFVRSKDDVKEIQDVLDDMNSPVKIIAKIENQEGVNNIDEILRCVYGVMIARGDLGIEVPQERIPFIQRMLIRKCVENKKPVIVATQMLQSMIKNPRPTRAEVSDVANAIFHRTDAIMLSGETAYGQYPREAVSVMDRIAKEVEPIKDARNDLPVPFSKNEITAYLAEAAVGASRELPIKAIITDSFTGKTARYVAAFRGRVPVYTIAYEARVARELSLSYGVYSEIVKEGKSKSEMLRNTIESLQQSEGLNLWDLVAYIGGSAGIGGGTTFVEFLTIENLLKKVESYVF